MHRLSRVSALFNVSMRPALLCLYCAFVGIRLVCCAVKSLCVTALQCNVKLSLYCIKVIRIFGMSSYNEGPILDSGANIHACDDTNIYRSQLMDIRDNTSSLSVTAAFGSNAIVKQCGDYVFGRETLRFNLIPKMSGSVISVSGLCQGAKSKENYSARVHRC